MLQKMTSLEYRIEKLTNCIEKLDEIVAYFLHPEN